MMVFLSLFLFHNALGVILSSELFLIFILLTCTNSPIWNPHFQQFLLNSWMSAGHRISHLPCFWNVKADIDREKLGIQCFLGSCRYSHFGCQLCKARQLPWRLCIYVSVEFWANWFNCNLFTHHKSLKAESALLLVTSCHVKEPLCQYLHNAFILPNSSRPILTGTFLPRGPLAGCHFISYKSCEEKVIVIKIL